MVFKIEAAYPGVNVFIVEIALLLTAAAATPTLFLFY
jgi:hypothetical protein